MSSRLIIQGGTLLPLTSNREVMEDAAVVIEDGLMVEITANKHYHQQRQDVILDAHGRIVMPGLVNAHTHLYQVLLRGVWDKIPLLPWLRNVYRTAEVLNPDDSYFGALLACVESIASGVTTICDHVFLNPTKDLVESSISAMQRAGVRSVVARAIMDSGTLPPECVKEQPANALEHVKGLLLKHGHGARGMLRLLVGPNTPPLNASEDLIKQVVEFAARYDIGTSTHVAESRDITTQCQQEHGCGVVEYLDSLGVLRPGAVLAHCVHISPDEIDIIAHRGASVAHNPVSNCMLGDGIAPVNAMVAAGVNVALGTDGAASNHTQDMFEVIKMTSLLQRVQSGQPEALEPYQILRMATIGGARALGIDHLVGTIEAGKRADLILINPLAAPHGAGLHDVFSHLVHTLKACDVETTVVDGAILMKDRSLLRQDLKEVIASGQRQAIDLHHRILENEQLPMGD